MQNVYDMNLGVVNKIVTRGPALIHLPSILSGG